MSNDIMKATHVRLQNLPQLFDVAHDFGYSPMMGKGELDTPISGGATGAREPGRFNKDGDTPTNDLPALSAYKLASQHVARAYHDCVRITLNAGKEIPAWPLADLVSPTMTRVPSPYEMGHGCRILTLAFLRLYASSAAELCETSSNGKLIGGPALAIEKAHSALQRVVGDPKVINEPEPETLITRAQLSEAARKAVQKWLT